MQSKNSHQAPVCLVTRVDAGLSPRRALFIAVEERACGRVESRHTVWEVRKHEDKVTVPRWPTV